jgi:hypothetical protein
VHLSGGRPARTTPLSLRDPGVILPLIEELKMKTPQIAALPGSTPLGVARPFTFTCEIRRVAYGADTLAELSAIYCRVRDASGEGASTFPMPSVKQGDKVIGRIAYNGRIFKKPDRETDGENLVLLFDNR